MRGAALLPLLFAASYLGLLAFRSALALLAVRRERRGGAGNGGAGEESAEGRVAVLQAVLSGDPRLGEVLEWNVRELALARFYWLVDDDDPEGARICREVAARWPGRVEVLSFPPPPERKNPKLYKLEGARAAAREEFLLVLDDDTRMPAATLAALLRALGTPAPGEGAALATSLPGYLDDGHWTSRLLAQFVANNAALTYLPLLAFRPALTINGMAYALRRDRLAAIGGFGPLLGALTDDLAVAEAVLASGGRIAQLAAPHWVETTVRDARHYGQLLHRWFLFALLLLRKQPPGLRLGIGLLNGTGPLLLWGLLVSAALAPGRLALGAVLATVALRGLGLMALQRSVYGRSLHAPLASLASELLQPLHLLHANFRRRIVWRKRRYRVFDDRRFEEIP